MKRLIPLILLVLFLAGCSEPAKKLFVEGETLASRGVWEEAREKFIDLVERYPDSRYAPEATVRIADIFGFVDKEFETALDIYGSLVLTYPQSRLVPEALLKKAEILKEKKRDIAGSLETLERIYQQYPDCSRKEYLLILMARCLEGRESFARERNTLIELIREHPSSRFGEEASYMYGMACLGDGLIDESLLAFKNMLGKYPGGRFAAKAEIGYAEALKEKMGKDEAAGYLSAVVDRYPPHDRVVINRRIVHLKKALPISKIRIPGRHLGVRH